MLYVEAMTIVILQVLIGWVVGWTIATLWMEAERAGRIAMMKFRVWKHKRKGWLDRDFDGMFNVIAEQGFICIV